ncbi:tryptophan-rich sensory protein [Parasphingopyxis algicola]|uniref:TspO/MBR family protein n=1 Tax=Parasphingopyxis algicola TaxID=2026624 RepID=UPI0015A449D7|nr:TspO/MBR family protein [Parasphingopyxis algicola]QLC24783.1 tryptophan-rich sensory protein [Parasphingopyxis algicola]
MSRAWIPPILVAAVAAALVAFLGATITDLDGWYRTLEQPAWAPPGYMYGMAWTAIYALVALAAVTAWRNTPTTQASDMLIGLFALNGFLNILWSLLFFRAQRPDWALIELIALWISIAVLIAVCGRYSKIAALLLLPYLAWVTFAGALNWEVVQLNTPFG